MRWQGRRESDNVEDRRNSSGGPSMGGPGFRLPSGKGGIILLIVVLVAGYYGVDLRFNDRAADFSAGNDAFDQSK